MDRALAELDGFAARDQWPEIVRAATAPIGEPTRAVDLSDRKLQPRRPHHLLAAAVIVLVVSLGVGVLVTRPGSPERPGAPATNATSPGTWSVSPPVPTPFPNDRSMVAPGGPLIAAGEHVVVAGIRGADDVVVVAAGDTRTVRLPGRAAAVAVGRDATGTVAEVVLQQDGTLMRIDGDAPRTLTSGLATSARSASVATANGRALVATNDGFITVDLATGARATVPGVRAALVAASDTTVWAVDQDGGTLTRMDAETLGVTGHVEARDVFSIAAAGPDVFVARRPANRLSRIGPDLVERPLAAIDPTASGLAATGSIVWVTADVVVTGYRATDGALAGTVGRPAKFGVAAAFDGESTWLLALGDGLRKLEPRR